MDNSPTNKRNSRKCSACRTVKKKCNPPDRNWEINQQKCERCVSKGLPCGPNLRFSDDPAVIQPQAVISERASVVAGGQAREPYVTAPTVPHPPDAYRVKDGRELLSVEDLRRKAYSKLDELHMFGNIQEYLSPDPFAYCQSRRNRPPCHDLSIIEKLHELFRDIYEVADEARAQNEDDVALSILFALVWALKLYPQLLETRKRHMLLKIARLFQEMGRRWDCEQVLLIIASKCKLSPLPSSEDPYHLLTTSMPASSMSIRHVLGNRFKETLSGNLVDLNLSMPPLHCAVQHQNPSIIIALLSNNNNCSSLQSAPAPTAPSNNAQMTVNIEDRDLHCWTALFAAVINGDADCCYTLLIHGADANTRDEYGHTALEVAVRRGNYDIVKILIENGAQVNPNILCCSSLPLHAAVENGNFQPEIIEYLINCDAKVDPRRSVDWKRATDFAYNQGHHMLAERMHRMIPNQHQAHFMHRDTSMDEIPRPQTNGTSTSTYN